MFKALVCDTLTMTIKLKWFTGNGRCIHGNNCLYECYEISSVLLGVLGAPVWKTSLPLWEIFVNIYLTVYVMSWVLVWQGKANWRRGREHCRIKDREPDLTNGMKHIIGINPPWGVRKKSSHLSNQQKTVSQQPKSQRSNRKYQIALTSGQSIVMTSSRNLSKVNIQYLNRWPHDYFQ